MMQLEPWKIITDIVASGVGILAIVCGGLFAVFEYLEKDSADRVKETLAFVEQFGKQAIYDARLRIDKTWIAQGEIAKKCARKRAH